VPRFPLALVALLGAALLGGCKATSTTSFPQCTLDATLSADQGAPGDVISITGREFSQPYDTVVTVGGTEAAVGDVTRTGCSLCDLCRQAAADVHECDACQTCFQCSSYCDTCAQAVTFTVPDVSPGAVSVVVQNRYGSSDALPFVVLPGGDTGATDTGDTATDTGTTDTGSTDTGTSDTSTTDTGAGGDTGGNRRSR